MTLLHAQLAALSLHGRLAVVGLVAAMILAAVIAYRQRIGAVLLAILAFVWFAIDSDFEGRVLIAVTKRNGLTESDLLGVLALIVAGVLFIRPRRTESRRCSNEALDTCALHRPTR